MVNILKASNALDELIATKVMGWTKKHAANDPERYGAPVYQWNDSKGNLAHWADDYMYATRWSPTRDVVDSRRLMLKLAHLVGDFQTGDGFFHLTYADSASHSHDHHHSDSDDDVEEKILCDPGEDHYSDDEDGKDLAPWSCHLHIGLMGRMGDGEYPPSWDHGGKFCARGATPELAICAVALKAYGLDAPA